MKYPKLPSIEARPGRPPRGGRGLKLLQHHPAHRFSESPPSRGAWIEILQSEILHLPIVVAPLAGGVD